jgi:hypothetical protein
MACRGSVFESQAPRRATSQFQPLHGCGGGARTRRASNHPIEGDLVFGRALKLRPMDHSARLWPPVPRMEPGRLGRLRIARWRSPRPGDHPAPGDEKIVGGALGVCGFSLGAKVTRGVSLHRIAVSPLARRPHSRRPLEDSRLHWLGKHRAGRHRPALAPKRLHMTSVTQLL